MFIDPQYIPLPESVAFAAADFALPRTSASINYGQFAIADASHKLTIQHAYGKRVRRTFRLDSRKVAPDPLLPSTNVEQSMSVYFVIDVPRSGFSLADQTSNAKRLIGWPLFNNFDHLNRFLGGES